MTPFKMDLHAHAAGGPAKGRKPLPRVLAHAHSRGETPHGHFAYGYVREPRVCPRCFGPMVLIQAGKDDRGTWERWTCAADCRDLGGQSDHRDVALTRNRPSDVILRDRDYERAAVLRARARTMRGRRRASWRRRAS